VIAPTPASAPAMGEFCLSCAPTPIYPRKIPVPGLVSFVDAENEKIFSVCYKIALVDSSIAVQGLNVDLTIMCFCTAIESSFDNLIRQLELSSGPGM